MKVRLVFQFGKGRLEAGAADKRHVRSKALFDIEALLREQPRQVRIDFEERVIRLDFVFPVMDLDFQAVDMSFQNLFFFRY